jgi:hypothetical protein
MKSKRRAKQILLSISITIILSACSDPYKKELPSAGNINSEQANDFADNLPDGDKELFLRWASRMQTPTRYVGETIPSNVEIALINQREFERRMELETIALKERLAKEAEEDAIKQKAIELKKLNEQKRLKVDALIKKYFIIEAVSYDRVPIFNSYGYASSYEWRFTYKITNKSPLKIIGISGAVLFSDAFQAELGAYPLQAEPIILPKQSINYIFSMTYNKNDPGQVSMLSTKTIYSDFLFDRLAFEGGNVISSETIDSLPSQQSDTANSPTI